MLCISDVQQLLSQWIERMGNPAHSLDYREAISECVYELNSLVSKSISEELDYLDYLDMEADSYLSTHEADELRAA